jgi:four helix bundle protein
MTTTIPNPDQAPNGPASTADHSDRGAFGFERLDCYRLALEFQTAAVGICADRRMGANLRDQLDRASVSVALNIAEGAGRRTAAEQAHFFNVARASANECAAILDIVSARGFLADAAARHGRGLLVRVVQMLTRLIERHLAS